MPSDPQPLRRFRPDGTVTKDFVRNRIRAASSGRGLRTLPGPDRAARFR